MKLDPFTITAASLENNREALAVELSASGQRPGKVLPSLQGAPSLLAMDICDRESGMIEEICIKSQIGFFSTQFDEPEFVPAEENGAVKPNEFLPLLRSNHGYDYWKASAVEDAVLRKMLDIRSNGNGHFVCIGRAVGFFSRMADVGLDISIPASPFSHGIRELVEAAIYQRGASRRMGDSGIGEDVLGVLFKGVTLTVADLRETVEAFCATGSRHCWIFWRGASADLHENIGTVAGIASEMGLVFTVRYDDGRTLFELERKV